MTTLLAASTPAIDVAVPHILAIVQDGSFDPTAIYPGEGNSSGDLSEPGCHYEYSLTVSAPRGGDWRVLVRKIGSEASPALYVNDLMSGYLRDLTLVRELQSQLDNLHSQEQARLTAAFSDLGSHIDLLARGIVSGTASWVIAPDGTPIGDRQLDSSGRYVHYNLRHDLLDGRTSYVKGFRLDDGQVTFLGEIGSISFRIDGTGTGLTTGKVWFNHMARTKFEHAIEFEPGVGTVDQGIFNELLETCSRGDAFSVNHPNPRLAVNEHK